MEHLGKELKAWLPEALKDLTLQSVSVYRREHPILSVIYAAAAVSGSYWIVYIIRGFMRRRSLNKKRQAKQKSRAEVFVNFNKSIYKNAMGTDRVKAITSMSLTELLNQLHSGAILAVDTLHAFQAQALKSHHDCNCLVEPIWEAEEQAQACDALLSKDKPLHGLPVSLKENYYLEGYDCTAGCSKYINQLASDDSVLVKVLKHQGAIPFVRTNIPQTMLSFDTTNPIYGQTKNPRDPTRSSGGSSGGEGSLIASNGSPLGFGSDIGGSIRIPANMCGIYGLKATHKRLSSKNMHPIFKGQTAVPAALGPMGRSVDDLVVAMKALLVPLLFELDPQVPPIPFRNEIYESKQPLRIGYLTYDGIMHAVPAQERAVLEAKAALERLGHTLVPWSLPGNEAFEAVTLYAYAMFGDGGQQLLGACEDDRTDHSVSNLLRVLKMPVLFKQFLASLIGHLVPVQAEFLRASCGTGTVAKWFDFNKRLEDFRRLVEESWKDNQLDAMLSPGLTCPAMTIGSAAFATGAVSYTAVYNVLNFPAGSLPVTKVNKEDMDKMADYPSGRDIWYRTIKKSMVGAEGLPVNVQVATQPWQEELCLRIMKELQDEIRFKY